MTPKLKAASVLLMCTLAGSCIAGPLGDAIASRHDMLRTNAGGRLQVGRTQRSVSLDEKPHVVHPMSKDPAANLPEKEQVINTPNEGSLRDPQSRYQLPQTVSSPKPPEQNEPKPQVVNLSDEQVNNLAEKPQIVFGSERDPTHNTDEKTQVVNLQNEPVKNLGEKPQVLNPDVDPVGNYKEKPNTLKATYPDVARSIDRRIGSPIKDTSTKIQERPQVPPRVPLPARPYGERDPVPQIPVPPSQSTISNAHRPPYGGNKQDHPGPPKWPAYPRPPFGYGVPVGNIQVPTTPRPPSCFYKSERYEHGESVETPEPCLNCTCQKGVLVCYLRVCPTIGTPAPGCFTAREAGQCCPSVFCSGDKKSETTTTPPPPTDDDYYDYPATIDYDTDTTTTTTTTTTTRRPFTISTRRYSFAPKPFKRPYDSGIDEVELSARTPSVIVEQTEQSTTAEDDVTVTATELSSTTTTTTKAATQTSSEATTARRPVTTFTPTTAAQKHQSAGTSSTPKDVAVTATGITPTATTSLPVKTTTRLVDPSGSGHGDNVEVPSESPASKQNTVQRPVHKDTTSLTTRTPSTTAAAADLEARTPAKPFGQDSDSNKRPEVIEGVPKVVVAATTTTTTTGGSTKVASTTALPFDSNEALADAGYVARTASPNEVEAPVRKPLTADEPVNSVEDALKGGGRDSIMFVSSTPLPFELHHSFDLQDLNTVSGAQGPNATTPLPPPTTSTPTTASTTTTAATTTTTTSTTTTTTEGPVVIPIQGCWKKGKLYRVGEPIPGTKDCETCFCSPRGPLCQRIECPPVALDCEPIIPQGHCCPTEYICNKTQVQKGIDYQVGGADKSIHHPEASLLDGHRDSYPLPRKSDDTLDYNSVPQPAYRPPTTQETLRHESDKTDKTSTASHTELPSHTTTVMPVTKFVPTPITTEKQPVFLATNSEKQGISTRPPFDPLSLKPMTKASIGGSNSEEPTQASKVTSGEEKTAVYRPTFPEINTEKKSVNESKTNVNGTLPSLSSLYRDTANTNDSKHLQEDIDNANRFVQHVPPLDSINRSPTPMPQEGLQFSDLIDRVFFPGKDDKKESGDVNLQTAQLSPVYSQAHIYNASSLGASVIEARYPVKENDTLQPVYGTAPAYHRPTAESSIGEAGSLKPLYGKPPSFREESSDELISQMHMQVSTTAEVHYEPAISLDTDSPSTNKSLVVLTTKNATVESSKPQNAASYENDTKHEEGERPHISIHPLELTPIYYDVRKYTTTRRPSTTLTTAGSGEKLGTMTTPGTTAFVHRMSSVADASTIFNESHTTKEAPEPLPSLKTTEKPDYNIWELMYFNRSVPTVKPTEASNTTETNIWKLMFFNHSLPTVEPTAVDNATYSSNEITKKILSEKPAEEVGFTTSVIKVRVGNTLNVSVDSSNQSKYRNVEEDGIIVSVYPEHQMDGGVADLEDVPLQSQVESRAISSGSLYKGIQHAGDKAKSPAELTQVISDIIKAHKSEEPEVITAPNIDFSKQGVMTVKVTPSNSFKVFSLVLLDKNGTSKHGTTSTTEPPVDTAPWAPMGSLTEDPSFAQQHSPVYNGHNVTSSGTLSSTESYESQASLTVQTKQLPTVASSETVEHPEKPGLHSTFRIVPFLAEDAIFRPVITTQPSTVNNNNTGAYPRIVNTDPRDTIEDNCFVGGHLYVNGEMIKKGNPCELCRCYYGRELCQQKNCPYPPSPACISEAVPGFCCPKYTCRPEDVYFPPDPETTPSPDNLVQQYTVNVWSARNPTRHAGFTGVHGTAQQSGHASRKSTSPWPTTSSFFLKNSPTLKPYLLQRRPAPQETLDRLSHLHSTEESGSYEETTPPPPTTMTSATTEPPSTSQSPSSSQNLWNIFQVSGCNIYGRLYGVNEVVRELSSKCKACTCTSLGVQCNETC
ncbi:uncharacterized protein LOC119161423 isoform X2 [Rhipicephalus microplus]|uniref:uncharacterized protein LOC119161423 isoform X2 n=1 Tax=Rhipicephalus microplus TaxID=6941 RepID=UPI003F6B263D